MQRPRKEHDPYGVRPVDPRERLREGLREIRRLNNADYRERLQWFARRLGKTEREVRDLLKKASAGKPVDLDALLTKPHQKVAEREPEIRDGLLRVAEVLKLTGIKSRTTLWRLEREGRFPARVKLSGVNGRAVAWHEREVRRWIAERQARRTA